MTSKKGKKRWIAPWFESEEKPSIYHCISRVVDRRFIFGDEEREKFRMFMRMMENFSGVTGVTGVISGWLWSGKLQILNFNPQPYLTDLSGAVYRIVAT